PTVRQRFDEYLRRIRTRANDSGLMRLVAKDGTERVWFYRNLRYDYPDGSSRVLGHAIDITDRVRTEAELNQGRKALRKANDELTSRVAERTAELQEANKHLRAEMEQRRQAEEELLRARNLESIAVLAGGIAHDFNNFLTVLQG